MDAAAVDRKLETLSGQIEALRVVIVATATLVPRKAALRQLIRELLDSQRELLLAHSVSEEFLAGLDLAGESMLGLIPQEDA